MIRDNVPDDDAEPQIHSHWMQTVCVGDAVAMLRLLCLTLALKPRLDAAGQAASQACDCFILAATKISRC